MYYTSLFVYLIYPDIKTGNRQMTIVSKINCQMSIANPNSLYWFA